jgi:hypothetical protein
VTLYAQLRVNIAASEGRDGGGEELMRSTPSSLEEDVGGLTAIIAAPANSAAATAIFKHVDIEVTTSVNLFPALM